MLQPSLTIFNFKIIDQKFHWNIQGANGSTFDNIDQWVWGGLPEEFLIESLRLSLIASGKSNSCGPFY